MNKYNIKTTKAFEEELLDIYSYIVDYLQEPKIANEKYKKIRNKILSLQYLPERYSRIFILHIFNKYQNYLNKL